MSGSMTGGIDASIPLQAGKGIGGQQNPLQTIGQFAGVQNALNSNKLFPLQQQQMEIANQRSGLGLQSDQSSLIQQQRQLGYASLAPLLAKKGLLTIDDMTSGLGGFEKSGGVSAPVLNELQHIQLTGNPAVDDATFRAHILANAQAPAAAAGAVLPSQGEFDQGPVIQPVIRGARGMGDQGVIQPVGPALGKGLSPGEATAPTQIGSTPKNQPIFGTRTQFNELATGGASPLGTGRLPPALQGASAHPPGIIMGAGPASEAAMQTQGAASAKAFQDIADQGVQARSQNSILGNMLADTANFTTGPTSLNINKATLMRYAPAIAQTFGIAPDAVAANESFDKLANQIAGAQGERSDARLSVAQGANPSSHLSQAGADLMLRQLQGNADYLQTRAKLAAEYPDQTDRAGFESKVGGMLDPRAFQYDRMTPAQRKTYASSLSTKDQKIVRDSYNSLHAGGFLGAQ